MIRLPMRGQLLEEHERTARTVAQLVLGQVRTDRVDPGRELLVLVEPMQVSRHADEGFLNQILRPIPVASLPRNKLNQPVAIPVIQLGKGAWVAIQVPGYELAVTEETERPDIGFALALDGSRIRHAAPF